MKAVMSAKQLQEAGIAILDKALILSTDDHPEICGDLEGIILLSPSELLLSNDSDFGVEGAQTQFWLVPLERMRWDRLSLFRPLTPTNSSSDRATGHPVSKRKKELSHAARALAPW
jgi:hypothetical protein